MLQEPICPARLTIESAIHKSDLLVTLLKDIRGSLDDEHGRMIDDTLHEFDDESPPPTPSALARSAGKQTRSQSADTEKPYDGMRVVQYPTFVRNCNRGIQTRLIRTPIANMDSTGHFWWTQDISLAKRLVSFPTRIKTHAREMRHTVYHRIYEQGPQRHL